jgi:peptidoglycan/LPS O-acetylase OafA/YrhL
MAPGTLMSRESKPLFEHIDCLRGYAILMVIACHTAFQFPELPWRFRQLAASGWHGVQLFFLASTLTLLMSVDWEASTRGIVNWKNFYIRRFFRIAPAYYIASLVYTWAGWNSSTTAAGAIGFYAFASAWMPTQVGQDLVPGAWSVSVEFSMYLVFPLLVTFARGRRRSALLLIGTLAFAYAANHIARLALSSSLASDRLDNFVYFWPPNQFPVFALANLFYELIYQRRVNAYGSNSSDRLASRAAILVSLVLLVIAAYLPLPRSFQWDRLTPPNFFFCSAAMCPLIYGIAGSHRTFLLNGAVARMGKVSFSAYIWHWLIYRSLCGSPVGQALTRCTRYHALAAYAAAFAVVVILCYGLSYFSYSLIERRGIDWSRRLVNLRKSALAIGLAGEQ